MARKPEQSDDEAKALEEATLRRLLQTPPKPHKGGKAKAGQDKPEPQEKD